jgi:hypothetical protein
MAEARSSTIFTWSPSSTATLMNLPLVSLLWCLITINPGAATSTTKHILGIARVAPHTHRPWDPRHAPRWIPGRSTAGDTLVSTPGSKGKGRSKSSAFLVSSGARKASEILGMKPSSLRRLAQKAASTMA